MASSSSSSSSSACRLQPQWNYENDVFVNFGKDTSYNFASHLFAALRRESVKAFSNERLKRGSEIMPERFKAIDGSKISIILFSKRYAFEEFCLEELVRIMECKKKYQIVIPVFYKVRPSDVRWQERSFGKAFVEHERNLMPRLDIWKGVLVEASNLTGLDSKVIRHEAKLVEEIVNDTVEKLESIADTMVKELEPLFDMVCERLDSTASSFWNNIELKQLHQRLKQVHSLLENAERYRSYRYWLLCPLFTDLKNLTSDVHLLMDDYENPDTQPRKFNQAVKKIDQRLLKFLDSVNNLVAFHHRERRPLFQQPLPRTGSTTYTCVEDIADNNHSFNLPSCNSIFKMNSTHYVRMIISCISIINKQVEDESHEEFDLQLKIILIQMVLISEAYKVKEVIFKLEIDDDQARKKAFLIVSQFGEIYSITYDSEDKKMTIIGCNLDTIAIGKKLRKLCEADLVYLGPAKMPEKGEQHREVPNYKANEKGGPESHTVAELVKARKASKLPISFLSRMCISLK